MLPAAHPAHREPVQLLPPAGLGADAVVRWYATRQSGMVTRQQLLHAGVSAKQIGVRTRRGMLSAQHRGVLRYGVGPVTAEGRLWAAVLALGPEATVSHRSAAALLGLLPYAGGPVHLTSPVPRRHRPGIIVHCSTSASASRTVRGGIPCTTVARTFVDLSGVEAGATVTRAWSTAASRRLLVPRHVEHELRRHPGRPGTPEVRALLERHRRVLTGRTRSDLERAALRMCADHGLPAPESNALLRIDDDVYEADLLWRSSAVVAELDAWSTHGDADAFRRDRARDFEVALSGHVTVRLLWDDVTRAAASTAAKLRRLLNHRADDRERR